MNSRGPGGRCRAQLTTWAPSWRAGLMKMFARVPEALGLDHAPALRSAARAHAVQTRGCLAERRRLAVRAQVGRLSDAGVSRRRRDHAAEPRREGDEPL